MAIRQGKPDDIVFLNRGHGPKARIIKRLNYRTGTPIYARRGTYYEVEILESKDGWTRGHTSEQWGYLLSRRRI